ncbi:MAG: sulfurtransferase [Solirubrobacteraceae bacterium]
MRASPLIEATQLRARLTAGEPTTLLDVRWQLAGGADRAGYAAGHIPGAAFVDLDGDLAAEPGPRGRHPLPAPDRFVASMRAAGVRCNRPAVVYDDAAGLPASRAWWLLRHYGHRAVWLLDGGLDAWRADGGGLATGDERPEPGDFDGRPGAMAVLDADGAAALAGSPDGALLDARAPERFRGEVEPLDAVAGHIPGASNWPMARDLDADGRLLPAAALRDAFAPLARRRVAAYCGSGITAAHTVLALELAGIEAALYPGSWSEWVADRRRPVATGTAE